jgi:hypothetical protein
LSYIYLSFLLCPQLIVPASFSSLTSMSGSN